MNCKTYAIPEDLFYDYRDFWIRVEGQEAVIGMTDYGQSNTGDILYLELSKSGADCRQGDKFGSIESGKWVGNLTAPLSGVIIDSNSAAERNPRWINAEPYGGGWMCRIEMTKPAELEALMNARQYAEWVAEQVKQEQGVG